MFHLSKISNLFSRKAKAAATRQADALIIDMQHTGIIINSVSQIKLQLQVLPDKGRNFILEGELEVPVEELDNYKCGIRLTVKYAADTQHRMRLISISK